MTATCRRGRESVSRSLMGPSFAREEKKPCILCGFVLLLFCWKGKETEELTCVTVQPRCSKRWGTCWRLLILFRRGELRRKWNQSSRIALFYHSLILHAGPICTCFRFVSISQGHFLSIRLLWSISPICLYRGAGVCVWERESGTQKWILFFDFILNSVLSTQPLVSQIPITH